jgi:peptide/nickel transport system ATP-binding protein
MVLGLITPDEGEVLLDGQPWSPLKERQRRRRRKLVQFVAQDPLSSFDPRYTVAEIVAESLDGSGLSNAQRAQRVSELLDGVQLGSKYLRRRPRELSGGQRQRVSIARALAPRPSLIVADEPVSALDVSVQAQILDLLADLQSESKTSILFISHDLGVVHHVADRVLVMKDGAVVESGPVGGVFHHPQHQYTQELISSLPRLITQ